METIEKLVLYVSQVLNGIALADSVVGMFSAGFDVFWTILRITGGLGLFAFYLFMGLVIDRIPELATRAGISFLTATIVLSVILLVGYITVPDPDLTASNGFEVYGAPFIVHLLASVVLDRITRYNQ
ncbi:MAG: hypothetical protein F7C82_05840 [Desulfurococcales archaeon]|nr:hypothetical protein [Desulfurococcales archaeon]MCE4626711.1 hypothetical protein [Desulfurococcales archaeon]MCE4629782.1 hypothetical protein [Desulfurococcales archaeon]